MGHGHYQPGDGDTVFIDMGEEGASWEDVAAEIRSALSDRYWNPPGSWRDRQARVIARSKLLDITLAECPSGYGYLYITVRSRADTVFAFADDVAARVADTLFRRLGGSYDLRVGHGYTSTPYSRPPSRGSTGDVGASQTPPSIAP
ncbi:hypothetical protein GG804_02120 [Sphingomonas histidinilytica]|uniref:hypothetical protein n=1 Tax=Rhizorhabdus histidinilytica TaxID=439228 RepID=UPI001ADCC577|nr:hypothetical protein [Rhizorhabdus histidinilytica]MBO9375551.1 hypothetical protein [Rhizorhabdus histidinilytica]